MQTFPKQKFSRGLIFKIHDERYVDKETVKSTDYAREKADEYTTKVSEVKEAAKLKFTVLKKNVRDEIPKMDTLTSSETYTVSPEDGKKGIGVLAILKDVLLKDVFKDRNLVRTSYAYMMKQDAEREHKTDINVIEPGDVIDVNEGVLSIKRGDQPPFEWNLLPFREWSKTVRKIEPKTEPDEPTETAAGSDEETPPIPPRADEQPAEPDPALAEEDEAPDHTRGLKEKLGDKMVEKNISQYYKYDGKELLMIQTGDTLRIVVGKVVPFAHGKVKVVEIKIKDINNSSDVDRVIGSGARIVYRIGKPFLVTQTIE